MPEIIKDPENFDGRYVDNSFHANVSEYDFGRLARYLKETNKAFNELSEIELQMFLLD